MPANRPDFQKWTFRFNLIITGIVFILLSPTVRIYRSWFPDKKDSLWFYPLAVIAVSGVLWFLGSLSLPALIRTGVIKDLRTRGDSGPRFAGLERYRKILGPILITAFHLILMLLFAASMIRFLQGEPFKKLYTNLP